MVFAWVFLDYSSTLIAAQTLPGKLALACFSEQQTEGVKVWFQMYRKTVVFKAGGLYMYMCIYTYINENIL